MARVRRYGRAGRLLRLRERFARVVDVMSIREPRISRVSDMRAEVKHDESRMGWVIDNDLIVGPVLFLAMFLVILAIICIGAGVL